MRRRRAGWYWRARRVVGRDVGWVVDEGPWAAVTRCRTLRDGGAATVVRLHRTREEALEDLGLMGSGGCGGACCGAHELIFLGPRRGE